MSEVRKAPWLSIIIPALNEEKMIGRCLRAAEAAFPKGAEMIVVDGGSSDRTVEEVSLFERARIVRSPPGRGIQFNRGAQEAAGSVLLFLHADVLLPPETDVLIRAALAAQGSVGGCFKVVTEVSPGRGPLFHLLVRTANWRSRYTKYPYGDQAIFVRREVFEDMGGFRDIPLMEDMDFSRRLYRRGTIVRVDAHVVVSGRRWEKNILVNAAKLRILPLLYRLGVSPSTLAKYYREVR